MAKLNTRQWRLYDFLNERYEENPKGYVSTSDIMNALPSWYSFTEEEINNHKPVHDTSAYMNIRMDINAIRNSEEVYKIVCSNSKGYKIATEEEANKWLGRVKGEALAKLKMYWKSLKNAESNNQFRIVFNSEKNIIEVFNN